MKVNCEWIATQDYSKQADVIVNSCTKKNIIQTAIGVSFIVFGTMFISCTSFKNGAIGHRDAQNEVLKSLGLTD